MQLYRARRKVLEEAKGKHAKSYRMIPHYVRMLSKKNLGSIVKMTYKLRIYLNPNPTFKRFFVCLQTCKDGFLGECKPFIGLDGY